MEEASVVDARLGWHWRRNFFSRYVLIDGRDRGSRRRRRGHHRGSRRIDGRRALALLLVLTSYDSFRELRQAGLSARQVSATLQETARELILTGRTITADEALDWGFVHRVGDRESETNKLVEELKAMPHAPLAITKEALRAYGRTVVSHEAAWADADLLYVAGTQAESRQAARDYLDRLSQRD